MIQTIVMKCPECGAILNVVSDKQPFFCEYCGTKILFDDGSKKININYKETDEAKIREIEAYENIELRKIDALMDSEKRMIDAFQAEERSWEIKRSRSKKIWLYISGAAAAIGVFLAAFFGSNNSMAALLTTLGFSSLFYGAIYFWISGTLHKSKMRKHGIETSREASTIHTSPLSFSKQGSLRIVRLKRLISGKKTDVFVDNKLMGSLKDGDSIVLFLNVGEHKLRLQARVHKSVVPFDNVRSVTQAITISPNTETEVDFISTASEYDRHKIINISQSLWINASQR